MSEYEHQKQAAEAIEAEATDTPRTVTFGSGENALTLEVPRKWKRFRFMRALSRGDLNAALEAVWQPVNGQDHPALARLDELDLDEEEFAAAMDRLGSVVGGTEQGNSAASPAS